MSGSEDDRTDGGSDGNRLRGTLGGRGSPDPADHPPPGRPPHGRPTSPPPSPGRSPDGGPSFGPPDAGPGATGQFPHGGGTDRPDSQGQMPPGPPPPGRSTGGQAPPGQVPPGQSTTGQVPHGQRPGDQTAAAGGTDPSGWWRRRWLLVTGSVIGILALAAGSFLLTRHLVGSDDDVETLPVELVPAVEAGAGPFTGDVTLVDDSARAIAVGAGPAVDTGAGERATGGLSPTETSAISDSGPVFGSRDDAVCDGDALARALAAGDDVRAAWADLMGIDADPETVAETIDGLTAVLLTRDTAVTNSRYVDGRPEQFQAVLQAGTGVFVDADGMPVVRCSCGNPLAPPRLASPTSATSEGGGSDGPDGSDRPRDVELVGEPWSDFDSGRVIEVTAAPPGTVGIPTIDLDTGDESEIVLAPTGSGELDGYLVDDDRGVHVVSEEGERTQILDHPVAAVFDDGEGGIVYQKRRSIDPDAMRATRDVDPADEGEAVLWHLPAGADEPEIFRGPEIDPDSWLALDGAGTDARGRRVIVYSEIGRSTTCPGDLSDDGCIALGTVRVWVEPIGGERWSVLDVGLSRSARIFVGDGFVASSQAHGELGYVGFQRLDEHGYARKQAGCEDNVCAVGFSGVLPDGGWLFHPDRTGGTVYRCDLSETDRVCDELDWELPGDHWFGITMSGDRGVLDAHQRFTYSSERQYLVDLSDDAESPFRELDVGGRASVLSAPIIRPADATDDDTDDTSVEAEPAPTDTGPERSPTWEQIKDASIPGFCEHEPTTLVDGVHVNIRDGEGFFELVPEEEGRSFLVRDLGSPDGLLTAVRASCDAGGTGVPDAILFFGGDGEYVASTWLDDDEGWQQLWRDLAMMGPARMGVLSMAPDGDVLVVRVVALMDEDALCCPSGEAEVRVRVQGGTVHAVGIRNVA